MNTLSSLSQDLFVLITTYLPLSILPMLRSVNHSINQSTRHPHCYSRYVHTIQSSDELDRLVQQYPSVRSFECIGTTYQTHNQSIDQSINQSASHNDSIESCIKKLTRLFPHLRSLKISNFHEINRESVNQSINRLTRLSCLSFESLPWSSDEISQSIKMLPSSLQELTLIDMSINQSTCQSISLFRLRKLNVSRCSSIDDECIRILFGINQSISQSINSTVFIDYVMDHLDEAEDDSFMHVAHLSTSQSMSRSITSSYVSPASLGNRSINQSINQTNNQLLNQTINQPVPVTRSNSLAMRRAVSTPSLQSMDRSINQSAYHLKSSTDWFPLSQHMRKIVDNQSVNQSSTETSEDELDSPWSNYQTTVTNRINQSIKSYQPSNLAQSINRLIVSHNRLLTDLSSAYLAFVHLSISQSVGHSCSCDSQSVQTTDESFLSYMFDLIDVPPINQSINQSCIAFPLQHIDLSYITSLTDRSISLITRLPHIQSISLLNNQLLTDQSINQLSHCHSLRHLSLADVHFSEQGLLSINQLTHLKSIKLSRLNGISINQSTHCHSGLRSNRSSLQSINQSVNPGLTDRVVFALLQLPHLSHMSVKQCDNVSDASARSINQSINLSVLVIAQCNRLSAVGFRLLGRAPKLKVLCIQGCRNFDHCVKQEIQRYRPGLLTE